MHKQLQGCVGSYKWNAHSLEVSGGKQNKQNQEKVKKDLGYGQTMDTSGNGFTP
jgi:uncharacterized GH25 family protein